MVYLLLVLLGLCLGSFAGAVIWRLQAQAGLDTPDGKVGHKPTSKKKYSEADLSIVKGRSMCGHCGHPLAVVDLMPVVSWVWLRGRCRYCRAPIGTTEILLELITPILFVVSWWAWPYTDTLASNALFGLWLMTLTGFVILLVYDIRWMLLPDRVVLPLIGVAAATVVVRLWMVDSPGTFLLDVLGSCVVASGIFYALFMLSNGRWIGGGDVKLGLVLGLLLAQPLQAFLLLFVASLLGTLFYILLLLWGRKQASHILPFGPFLIVAASILFLWGYDIIDWYTGLLLPPL